MTSFQKSARPIERSVTPNGVRVVTEHMENVRSVSLGLWVDVGSRHEAIEDTGISHFTEHMVFKGTSTRSAEDIACSVDSIGGHLDAFTTKEGVAFTAKVLDEHLPIAFDVLSDMVIDPLFREEDIEKERGVVLEELKMDEDSPDYLIQDIFASNFWKDHGLGRPIIGNKESISRFGREQLKRFFDDTYRNSNLLITAAGNIQHDDFLNLVQDRFRGPESNAARVQQAPPTPKASVKLRDKPSLEQVHLCLGIPSCPMNDPLRYAAYVLNTLLGGGMSSRLFLKIREREGLAYSVFSDLSAYSDAGCMTVYAGMSIENTRRVIDHILREFQELKRRPVSKQELVRAKAHLKGSLMLSLESTTSRMANLARQERYFGKFISLDEVIAKIEGVEAEHLQELAASWFVSERIALAVLGNLNGFTIAQDDLVC